MQGFNVITTIFLCFFGVAFISSCIFITVTAFRNIKKARQQHLEQMGEDGDKVGENNSNAQEHKGGKVVICPYCKTKNGVNESECKNCGAIL